ncbi:MAG: hypothetical protein H6559_06655 [Lewinellaceae bacterium]|nr:hypothetical protein [Lewinellaceae bacterium]
MKSELQIPKTKKMPGRWCFFWAVFIGYAVAASGASYPCLFGHNLELSPEKELVAIHNISPCSGEDFERAALEKYARLKHEHLLAHYPDYAAANVDLEAFIDQYGEDVYLAAAILYEAFMDELGENPDDPYLWQLAMEVFQEELFPILLEFTPGIGDLIGAYNDFHAGHYFWGCVGIVGAIVPGDEVIKVIRKADNIRDAWRKVEKVFTLWNKLFSTVGGRRVLSKMPESWKGLPGSKLADKQGLYWKKDNFNNLRIMDGKPKSPWPNQRVPYVRVTKNGVRLDEFGNPVDPNSPNFQELTHIPLSAITDDFLDKFFN